MAKLRPCTGCFCDACRALLGLVVLQGYVEGLPVSLLRLHQATSHVTLLQPAAQPGAAVLTVQQGRDQSCANPAPACKPRAGSPMLQSSGWPPVNLLGHPAFKTATLCTSTARHGGHPPGSALLSLCPGRSEPLATACRCCKTWGAAAPAPARAAQRMSRRCSRGAS